MDQNQRNFDCYHLRQDYSHKTKGQSKEFLGKQQQAVDQIASFTHQGLMDLKDWFDISLEAGVDEAQVLISPKEQQLVLNRSIQDQKFYQLIEDSLKVGLLGSLMICKVHGEMVSRSRFETERDGSDPTGQKKKLLKKTEQFWELRYSLIRQEDYYPDPTGRGLYEIQGIDLDYHELLKIAENNPNDYSIEAVRALSPDMDSEQERKKSRETGQDVSNAGTRKQIRVLEQWGTILDPTSGEVLHENAVAAITECGKEIRPPKPNPFWHGESPYVVAPIVRVPFSVWHRAMMDAATGHNISLNELYNLMFDGGMQEVFGVRQVREHWLDDPSQIADGIPAGTTLSVNTACPPGAKVMDRIDSGTLSSPAFNMFQIVDREFMSSSMTNDLRMGNLPQRQVKATEIMASNQTITSLFNGVVKDIETQYISELLRKGWLTQAQHFAQMNEKVLESLLGADRAAIIRSLQNEDIFASTALGRKYKVFGMSTILNKVNDFRKITTLLQTISSSPELVKAFQQKYSLNKLLGEIISSLDIDGDKIGLSQEEAAQIQQEQMQAQQMAMMEAAGKNPDMMSQVGSMENLPAEGADEIRSQMNEGMTEPGA
jgi:hypothetical protein